MHGQQNIKLSRHFPLRHRIKTNFLDHVKGSEGSVSEATAAGA